jgi:GrpB-like predicted nucleotidyltransferase (UPF0157 family)
MIGLEEGVVRLSPYDPEWVKLFNTEQARLTGVIGVYVLDIQHVGSTAIPGMLAKPIIDIGVAVVDFDQARVCIPPLEMLGYIYRGEYGLPRRHYFVNGEPHKHHVHINEINGQNWGNHVLFRDYLIAHPEVAGKYAALKTSLAARYPNDREAYLEGKAPFIQRILADARQERMSIASSSMRLRHGS